MNDPSLSPLHRAWRALPAGPRRRWLARGAACLAPRPDRPPPPVAHGAVVVGELSRASGLGQAARLISQGLQRIGRPVQEIEAGLLARSGAFSLPPPGWPLLLHINAPHIAPSLLKLPRGLIRGRRVVGVWAWELPVTPPEWRHGLRFVHEIWTFSAFTRDALQGLVRDACPIRRVLPPLGCAPPQPSGLNRGAFGLPADAVITLVSFSLASSFVRKNPLAAIAAHRAAFGDRPDRILLLKLSHSDHHPQDVKALRDAIQASDNIRLDTRTLPQADLHALTLACDIVLSLHRSEGFGLVPAEAMLLGRPVIATGWSGNMDFMDHDSAALVPFRMVPARDPRGVFEARDACWADPDIQAAAAWLRILADDPSRRAALAARGQAMVQKTLDTASLAEATAQWR